MSGAEDELPSGSDPSPNEVLSGTIGYLGAGGTLGTLLQGAIFGTIVSVFTGGVNLIQSVVGLVVAPLDGVAVATDSVIRATIVDPLSIISESAAGSADAIVQQFGPFAFIVGVAVLLGGFFLIIQFLEEDETPDFLIVPGFPDIPAIGPVDVGVEEEDEE